MDPNEVYCEVCEKALNTSNMFSHAQGGIFFLLFFRLVETGVEMCVLKLC